MGYAGKLNKSTNRFNFQSDQTFDFFKLVDLYNEDPEAVHVIRSLWFLPTKKQGFKDTPIITLDDRHIKLPAHMTEVIQGIIDDPEGVDTINNQKLGFKVRTYEDKTYGQGTCYSVEFVDL